MGGGGSWQRPLCRRRCVACLQPHRGCCAVSCSVLRRSAAASEDVLAPSCSRMLSTQVGGTLPAHRQSPLQGLWGSGGPAQLHGAHSFGAQQNMCSTDLRDLGARPAFACCRGPGPARAAPRFQAHLCRPGVLQHPHVHPSAQPNPLALPQPHNPAVFVDKDTRVIVQGFTGRNGTFHSEQVRRGDRRQWG